MIEEEEEQNTPVIPLRDDMQEKPGLSNVSTQEDQKSGINYRWLAIAAAIALLISLAFNFNQFQRIQENQAQIASLTQSNEVFAEQNQRTSEKLEVISSPLYKRVDMMGQAPSPNSVARVYYSASKNKIYLNTGNLSLEDKEKQFQLWAIIDGQPVDAGVFDPVEGELALVKSLSGNIQAFAVTLEPRGGSKTPTLDQMYVMGAVG